MGALDASQRVGRIGAEGVIRRLDDTLGVPTCYSGLHAEQSSRVRFRASKGGPAEAFFCALGTADYAFGSNPPYALQKYDFEAKGDWDIVAKDFGGIADRMGC